MFLPLPFCWDLAPVPAPQLTLPLAGQRLQGNPGWEGPGLVLWPNVRKLLVPQVWESVSVGTTEPQGEGIGQEEQQVCT